MAAHSSILAWRSPWTEETGGYNPWDYKESDTTEKLTLSLSASMGGDYRGEWIHACVWLSYSAAHLKLSQCC